LTVTLQRLSICDCGFAVLDESIRLGTEYQIEPSSRRSGFFYRCGGCGTTQLNVEVVNASQILKPSAPMAPLPYLLFVGTANARPPEGSANAGGNKKALDY